MKNYLNVKSYLKAMKHFSNNQEIEMMRGYDKLPREAQKILYYLIGEIQNNIGELEDIIGEIEITK